MIALKHFYQLEFLKSGMYCVQKYSYFTKKLLTNTNMQKGWIGKHAQSPAQSQPVQSSALNKVSKLLRNLDTVFFKKKFALNTQV